MKLNKFNYLILALIATALIFSCKKDKDVEVLPSLDGILNFEGTEFINPETKLTFKPKGITHPKGKELGYYWKVSPDMMIGDTTKTEDGSGDGSFSYLFSDSLGTYTVTATAYASGYYSSSFSKYVTIVSSNILNGSITGAGFGLIGDDFIIDSRDSRKYFVTKIGNQEWLRQNLSYSGPNNDLGHAFRDAEVMSNIFGRYYTWEEAQNACPDGWKLPSEADWTELGRTLSGETGLTEGEVIEGIAGDMMVNASFNTNRLWEYFPAVNITNSSRLSIIPTGYAQKTDSINNFDGIYDYATFWTSDENPENPNQVVYRYINKENPDLFIGVSDKSSFATSIRCIKK